jgi:hypothetical protein
MRLARVSEIFYRAEPASGSVQLLVRGKVAGLPLKSIIDVAAEQARLEKEPPRSTPTSSASMARQSRVRAQRARGDHRGCEGTARGGGRPPRENPRRWSG